ncbi:hypothetical protein GALL_548940 [mine drainage metagenome]|uniref:Uncharacterized protein n=1 Tax=mine drainage metagenome TaxID=410659 RepID=A0A1J5P7Y0_9ZZZZ
MGRRGVQLVSAQDQGVAAIGQFGRTLDEQPIQTAVGQVFDAAQVGGELLGRHVDQVYLQVGAGLQPAQQKVDTAPQGFDVLQLGVVQHGTHQVG